MPPDLGQLKNTVIVVIGCCQEERAVSPGWGTDEKYSHCGHWLPPVGEELSPLDGEQLKNTVIVVICCHQLERSCAPPGWGTAEKYSH